MSSPFFLPNEFFVKSHKRRIAKPFGQSVTTGRNGPRAASPEEPNIATYFTKGLLPSPCYEYGITCVLHLFSVRFFFAIRVSPRIFILSCSVSSQLERSRAVAFRGCAIVLSDTAWAVHHSDTEPPTRSFHSHYGYLVIHRRIGDEHTSPRLENST